ncbi:hypothetical protein P154DRAFT_452103, partial [Amniculicola lignicola CBS 123094]
PVRSPIFKPVTGGLVVRWVTTSEYPLLYVFVFAFLFMMKILSIRPDGLFKIPLMEHKRRR